VLPQARVAEVIAGRVVVNEWLKHAILLLFRASKMETIELGPFEYADKIPLKRATRRPGSGWCPAPRPAGGRSSPAAWC
jgi:2,3,4,5-tetrahydropyridine-2,6-dicarboxylate N-succinyltransferase